MATSKELSANSKADATTAPTAASTAGPAEARVNVTPRFTTLALLPLQVRIGDRVVDASAEWEVIDGPWSMVAGDVVCVIIQRPGDPATKRELAWAAREKITVQRKV